MSLLLLPLLSLLLRSLSVDIGAQLQSASLKQAVSLSFSTTAVSSLLIVLLATPLAYSLSRWHFFGRALLAFVLELPLVLPPLVAGVALLLAFGRNGVFGAYLARQGWQLTFTPLAVVLAQIFVAAPLYIRSARLGFASVPKELIEVAQLEGASENQLFIQVMVPLAKRALLTGLVLAWSRALGELGASLFFAGNIQGRTQTIPLAIFVAFESNLTLMFVLALLLLLISSLVLLLLRWLGRERLMLAGL